MLPSHPTRTSPPFLVNLPTIFTTDPPRTYHSALTNSRYLQHQHLDQQQQHIDDHLHSPPLHTAAMFGSYSSSSSSSSSYTSGSPFNSYSSFSRPMDIAPTPFATHGPDASCAFPSWPRRANLDYDVTEERASSYLSDEDLFLDFEDDSRSVSSNSSSGSPVISPPTVQLLTEADLLEQQRERANYQREMMRVLMHEKERLRQQKAASGRRRRSGASSSSSSTKKASKSSKLNAMTPIAEAE